MTATDFPLLLAQTRSRLDKLTRPTFEREVVEALLTELDRLNIAAGRARLDLAVERDEDADDDDFDWDAPLNPREWDMEQTIDSKSAELDALSTRASNLQMELARTEQQAHAFAMQIQWFLDATPEAIAARLTYLREMRTRLGEAELPQDSAIQSR